MKKKLENEECLSYLPPQPHSIEYYVQTECCDDAKIEPKDNLDSFEFLPDFEKDLNENYLYSTDLSTDLSEIAKPIKSSSNQFFLHYSLFLLLITLNYINSSRI